MVKYLPFEAKPANVIYSLLSEYQWLGFLKNRNKPYEVLLDYLMEVGMLECKDEGYRDEDSRKVSKVAEKLHISSAKIRKWVFQIYDDLLKLNQTSPELFALPNHYHHRLSFSSYYGYYYCINIWLPIQLERYNFFNFTLMYAKVKETHFYAKCITITRKYGKAVVDVELKADWLINEYRELLYDKLVFTNQLSIDQQVEWNDYKVDELLREYLRKNNSL